MSYTIGSYSTANQEREFRLKMKIESLYCFPIFQEEEVEQLQQATATVIFIPKSAGWPGPFRQKARSPPERNRIGIGRRAGIRRSHLRNCT